LTRWGRIGWRWCLAKTLRHDNQHNEAAIEKPIRFSAEQRSLATRYVPFVIHYSLYIGQGSPAILLAKIVSHTPARNLAI